MAYTSHTRRRRGRAVRVTCMLCALLAIATGSSSTDLVLNDIERRVANAGGARGKLTVSLSWGAHGQPPIDLDIHLFTPGSVCRRGRDGNINFRRKASDGFILDVDMCASPQVPCPQRPVENIVFAKPRRGSRQPLLPFPGRYAVLVRRYGGSVGHGAAVPFEVALNVRGDRLLISDLCTGRGKIGAASDVRVVEFEVRHDGSLGQVYYKHKPMDCPVILRLGSGGGTRVRDDAHSRRALPRRSRKNTARMPARSARAKKRKRKSRTITREEMKLDRELVELGFSTKEARLIARKLGLESIDDAALLVERDLEGMDVVTALQKKRLLRWSKQLRTEEEEL